MKTMVLTAAVVGLLAVSTASSRAEPHMSQIGVFAFGFCPKTWVPADGRLLQIATNQGLFALLGTKYGGNGTTNFAVPKITAVSAPSNGIPAQKITICIAAEGVFPAHD